jgi:hypothetical protein
MGAADGSVLGLTKLFDSGPPSIRWNLVIVSDGYRASEMAQFASDAQGVTDQLLAEPPFDRPELTCAMNIYRLDVTSTDSGADKPNCADGNGTGDFVDTYFDATFCVGGDKQRAVGGNVALVQDTVEDWIPEWHQILVLVNDPERGGAAGSIGWFSTGGNDWRETAIHELGHSAFGLADEYDYDGPDVWEGGEPSQPNVSTEPDPALVKWSALVTAGPDVPTRANPHNCTQSDIGINPLPAGTVGTFEGAKYSRCGIYRPVWSCMMQTTLSPFCPVCIQAILDVMAPFSQPAPSGDIELATLNVNFNDVPTGLTVVRAARFDCNSCFPVTFEATTPLNAPFALESQPVTVASPSGPTPWRAYFWFRFTAGAVGPVAAQQVTLRCLETGEDFVVTLDANVVARPTVATQLVFDQSGSMLDVTDEGRTKEQVLKDSARVFADLLWDDNGIGVNAYDQDPHPIMDVKTAGAPGDGGGRDDAINAIGAFAANPSGMTAIGDGIELARTKLDDAPGSWDHRAMIVLTDGIETADKRVADVADGVINTQVFAIGMGTAEQIQPATLNALTSGTGGYLLMTGNLSQDETFLLEKYYVQILAGVNNNEIVLDPEGWARPGVVDRIPFHVTDSDVEITAMVLGRPAHYLTMALETPEGETVALGNPSLTGRTTPRALYMRAGLPLLADGVPGHAGRWHLLLTIHPEFWKRFAAAGHDAIANGPAIHYSASVAAYSNLRMATAVHQSSMEPGATLTARALLTEYGAPFKGQANVAAELVRPDGQESLINLIPVAGEPGAFQATRTATQSGVYRFRVLARGRTGRDQRFTREAIRTAAVWHGGDRPPAGNGGKDGPDWCAILECLLGRDTLSDALVKRLAADGIDVAHLRACLARLCRGNRPKNDLKRLTADLRRALEAFETGETPR